MRHDYTLLRAQRINGRLYPVDTPLNLPADLGERLCAQGMAKRSDGAAPAPAKPAPPAVRKRCCGW